jgi:hypothetical protein
MASTRASFEIVETKYHVTALVGANTMHLLADRVDIIFRAVGADTDIS